MENMFGNRSYAIYEGLWHAYEDGTLIDTGTGAETLYNDDIQAYRDGLDDNLRDRPPIHAFALGDQIKNLYVHHGQRLLTTLGYYEPNDGGWGVYERSDTQPAEPGWEQSLDGSYWRLTGDTVYIEQFGGRPNAGYATAAVDAATEYLRQKGGGTLMLLHGQYAYKNTQYERTQGIKIRGKGTFLSILAQDTGGHGIVVEGDQSGTKASYGFVMDDLSMTAVSSQPTGGAHVIAVAVQEMSIRNVCFLNYYRAIQMSNCQGPLVKQIHNVSFISPTGTSPIGGSACIYLQGILGAPGTGLTETVHISDCRGGGTGTQYCVIADGIDQVHVSNSHFWASQEAVLKISSTQCNVYNFMSSNSTWEAINGHAQYAVLIDLVGVTAHSIQFNGDQFLNGAQSAVCVRGAASKYITFSNCHTIQAMFIGYQIHGGSHIIIDTPSFIDGNISENGSGFSAHIEIGDGVTAGPDEVQIIAPQSSQEFFASLVSFGLNVRSGTNLSLLGGRFKDVVTELNSNVPGSALRVTGYNAVNDNVSSNSVATINVPLSAERLSITGNGAVSTINGMYKGRKLQVYIADGCTLNNGAGNLLLDGAANWAAPAGSYLFLEYDHIANKLIERGRRAA